MRKLFLPVTRFSLAIVVSVITLFAGASYAQPTDPSSLSLARIEFSGLKNVSQDQSIAATGLHVGQRITKSDMEKAVKELHDSGLFQKVQYKYRQYEDRYELTFLVVEWDSNIPVIFDNFVWFTDKELNDAVRQELPDFEGLASQAQTSTDAIKRALKKLLQDYKLPGEIDSYSLSPDVNTKQPGELVFLVKGISMPICSIHFLDTGAISDRELASYARGLLARNYSVTDIFGYTDPLRTNYGHLGYLRATFSAPIVKLRPAKDGGCAGGVDVSIKVDQGLSYKWDKAEWSGNQAISTPVLDQALRMHSGEIADRQKINEGFMRISRAYGKNGYLLARLALQARYNDPSLTVIYGITITEGVQHHMGKVIVTGATETEAKRFVDAWTLREGEVYDDSYTEEFLIKIKGISYPQSLGKKRLSFASKIDLETHTVNVAFEFK